jgi:hypothetical protein
MTGTTRTSIRNPAIHNPAATQKVGQNFWADAEASTHQTSGFNQL